MDNAIWQPTNVGINAPSVSSILEPDGDNLIVHVINDEYWDTANVANIKIFTDMRLCRAVPNNAEARRMIAGMEAKLAQSLAKQPDGGRASYTRGECSMNDETIDYLDMAMDVMSHDFDGFDEIVAAYAAIAQAQALKRIAECLAAITDDMVQTKRTLREWEGEL